MGFFHHPVLVAVLFFLQIMFWEEVLSSQVEETSEKKTVHPYRSTRLRSHTTLPSFYALLSPKTICTREII